MSGYNHDGDENTKVYIIFVFLHCRQTNIFLFMDKRQKTILAANFCAKQVGNLLRKTVLNSLQFYVFLINWEQNFNLYGSMRKTPKRNKNAAILF